MKFVATKTVELDLQALHRVRKRMALSWSAVRASHSAAAISTASMLHLWIGRFSIKRCALNSSIDLGGGSGLRSFSAFTGRSCIRLGIRLRRYENGELPARARKLDGFGS
jgi:hypothetical protein